MRLFEGIRRSRALSMSDPRTGGVTQAPRKMKENGVKNLKGAQAIPEFTVVLDVWLVLLSVAMRSEATWSAHSALLNDFIWTKRIFDFLTLPY